MFEMERLADLEKQYDVLIEWWGINASSASDQERIETKREMVDLIARMRVLRDRDMLRRGRITASMI